MSRRAMSSTLRDFEETRPKKRMRKAPMSQCLAEEYAGSDSDAEDDEFKMQSPKFYALYSTEDQTWSTHHGNYVYENEATYPDFMNRPGSLTIDAGIPCVKKLTNEARVLLFRNLWTRQNGTLLCHHAVTGKNWGDRIICNTLNTWR
jgi:hypothetical protein